MQQKNNDQLLNFSYQTQNNPHFCILPFSHFHIGTTGDAKLCCMAKWQLPVEKSVVGHSLIDIWTGNEYRRLRAQMINGEAVQACAECYKVDASGGGSDRETHTKQFRPPHSNWELDIEQGNTDGRPIWADIRPGRFCNLKCRMCFSSASSKIAEEIIKHPKLITITGDHGCNTEEWIDNPDLFKQLQDWIPHLRIIKLAGGEPFFMPGVIKLLKWCVETGNTHLELDITTNGTRINGKVARWLKEFNKVQIHISIDGIGPLNDYIRSGSNWSEINESYEYYLNENMTVNILSTVQLYNAHYLPDIIRYWQEHGSHNHLVFNFVDAPTDMGIHLLPATHRVAIANEIEMLVSSMSPELRSKCRFNATIARFRQLVDSADIDVLRKKWIARTDALDEIREEQLSVVNPELFNLYTAWKKITQ